MKTVLVYAHRSTGIVGPILTMGGPAGATDILITRIYQNAFKWLRFDRAAIMAFITFLILTGVSIIYARIYFKQERA